jgi:hypothetical protein
VSSKEIFDGFEAFFPGIPVKILKQTPLAIWDEYGKKGIKKPDNINDIIAGYHTVYFDCFNRILKYYDKKDKFHIGIYPTKSFNAEANTVQGEKVIIVDEFLISFFIQFLLGLYHLTYIQDEPLSKGEEETCRDFLQFLFEHFYHREQVSKERRRKFDAFSDFLFSKNYQFACEVSSGALTVYYFIVAHELGHHYYSHAAGKKHSGENTNQAAKEFEADAYAYSLLNALMNDEAQTDHTSVPHEFCKFPLLMFDILEIYCRIIPGSSKHHSHPEPQERKKQLESVLQNKINIRGNRIYCDILETLNELKFHKISNHS